MADNIRIKLPDGSEKQVPKGTTALDIARSISPRLADAAVVAKIAPIHGASGNGNKGQLVDLAKPIEQDAEVRILTDRDPESLEV